MKRCRIFAKNLKTNKMGKMKEIFLQEQEMLSMDTRVWMMSYDSERDRRVKLEQEIEKLKLIIKTLKNDRKK